MSIGLTREQAAERRIKAALWHIEEAQNHMARASAALSSIVVGPEAAAPMKLHRTIKALWYKLNDKAEKLRRAGKLLLVMEPTEDEREWGPLPGDALPASHRGRESGSSGGGES